MRTNLTLFLLFNNHAKTHAPRPCSEKLPPFPEKSTHSSCNPASHLIHMCDPNSPGFPVFQLTLNVSSSSSTWDNQALPTWLHLPPVFPCFKLHALPYALTWLKLFSLSQPKPSLLTQFSLLYSILEQCNGMYKNLFRNPLENIFKPCAVMSSKNIIRDIYNIAGGGHLWGC